MPFLQLELTSGIISGSVIGAQALLFVRRY